MAVESYGRTDDGIAWVVYHRLGGPWWWTMTLPDGRVLQSPDLYETEARARAAVEDARQQVLAGLPVAETMASLRARAEAAEARAETAEAVTRGLVAMYDGELQRQKAAIVTEADARVAAAEARAVQAEADARLMLGDYFGADRFSIVRFGLGGDLLSIDDLRRLGRLRDATFYTSEADTAAAMLRILATAGAT